MGNKKRETRKYRRLTCSACGAMIPNGSPSISRIFDGFTYCFDSRDCLLIFKKLRVLYGINFFRKIST
jgi:hypothetical protein